MLPKSFTGKTGRIGRWLIFLNLIKRKIEKETEEIKEIWNVHISPFLTDTNSTKAKV